MANPFTRFLRSLHQEAGTSSALARFVAHWDTVEAIVVDVHRRGAATEEEREAYAAARAALLAEYDSLWGARFAPLWPETIEGGNPPPSDPFPRILAPARADGFVGNWRTMQALAAARETLNRYILSLA